MSKKPTSPETLYGTGRDYLREQIKTNEILADIAGVEYTPPEGVPKGKYMENKWLLDAAEKKNELLEEIAEGGPGGGSAAAKAIGIDYATDGIFLKNKNGDTIQGSGATLPAYGVTFDPATGGLTLTKNGTAMQGQTVTIPNYGSPVGVDASADMTDHDKIYLYLGTTGGGLTNGHFYYWDGAAWTDGGEYAAATVQTDKTLLVEDRAADAKATGDAINSVKTQLTNTTGNTIIPMISGHYINLGGDTADVNSPGDYAGSRYAVVECKENDTFYIDARGYSSNIRTFGFVAEDGTILYKTSGTYDAKTTVVAPKNAKYLVINDSSFEGYCYIGEPLENKVDKNEFDNEYNINRIADISNNLVNPNDPDVTSGRIYPSTGGIITDTHCVTSGFIRIKTGANYIRKIASPNYFGADAAKLAVYDENKNFITWVPGEQIETGWYVNKIIFGAYYARISTYGNTFNTNNSYFGEGTTVPTGTLPEYGFSIKPDGTIDYSQIRNIDNSNLAFEYQSDGRYSVGDFSVHDGKLYKCITPISADEPWTASHWEISPLAPNVTSANNGLNMKVNKPAVSPNGTAGQLLRTNGDGTTEWTDAGTPTAEQVETAVDAWLDDNPQATTTVEDGAITKPKFNDALLPDVLTGAYTITSYTGDLGTAVNAAFAEHDVVIIPAKDTHYSYSQKIVVPTHKTLITNAELRYGGNDAAIELLNCFYSKVYAHTIVALNGSCIRIKADTNQLCEFNEIHSRYLYGKVGVEIINTGSSGVQHINIFSNFVRVSQYGFSIIAEQETAWCGEIKLFGGEVNGSNAIGLYTRGTMTALRVFGVGFESLAGVLDTEGQHSARPASEISMYGCRNEDAGGYTFRGYVQAVCIEGDIYSPSAVDISNLASASGITFKGLIRSPYDNTIIGNEMVVTPQKKIVVYGPMVSSNAHKTIANNGIIGEYGVFPTVAVLDTQNGTYKLSSAFGSGDKKQVTIYAKANGITLTNEDGSKTLFTTTENNSVWHITSTGYDLDNSPTNYLVEKVTPYIQT